MCHINIINECQYHWQIASTQEYNFLWDFSSLVQFHLSSLIFLMSQKKNYESPSLQSYWHHHLFKMLIKRSPWGWWVLNLAAFVSHQFNDVRHCENHQFVVILPLSNHIKSKLQKKTLICNYNRSTAIFFLSKLNKYKEQLNNFSHLIFCKDARKCERRLHQSQ